MAGPSPMLDYAYFEGNIVPFADAKISVGTHAVQYGTGAFAGIRGYLDEDGETINIFRLPEHTARLLNSAKLLRAKLPFTRESLAQTIRDALSNAAFNGGTITNAQATNWINQANGYISDAAALPH